MTTEETNFLKTWCRIQQSQLDVNKLLGTCRHCVGNIPRSPTCDRTPSQKTDIRYSYVSWKDIQPAGDFSRIFINTRNSSNQEKSNGGDYWRVFLNGPSFLSATVFDLGNGTYEAVFLPVVAGRYKLDVILVYTQCKGVIDPLRYSTDSGMAPSRSNVDEFMGNFVSIDQFTHTYRYVHVHEHEHTYVHEHEYTRTCAHANRYRYIHVYEREHVHIHVRTRSGTFTFT